MPWLAGSIVGDARRDEHQAAQRLLDGLAVGDVTRVSLALNDWINARLFLQTLCEMANGCGADVDVSLISMN